MALLVLALLAGAGLYAYRSLVASVTVTYQAYSATVGTISNALSFSGSFALVDSATYGPSSNATVRAVYVAPGDKVREGDKLARLSNGETLKAEFDGTVNTVGAEEGDSVLSGASLVQIADFEHMTVSIRVDEYDISAISVGQACSVTATATEQTFSARIDSINYISASSGNVAYYTAKAAVTVSAGIYPGMQATITITQEEANDVVILKADALSFDESNNAFVYLQNASGEMETAYVGVGVSNGNYVEITEGLADGDTVYAVVEEETESSGISGLLSGLLGGRTQVQGGMNRMGGGSMPDMSNFDFGGGSGLSGGDRGSFSGGAPSFGG